MTPFLAYLARRKNELQALISDKTDDSGTLNKHEGALEELEAVIRQLPAPQQEIVENLHDLSRKIKEGIG